MNVTLPEVPLDDPAGWLRSAGRILHSSPRGELLFDLLRSAAWAGADRIFGHEIELAPHRDGFRTMTNGIVGACAALREIEAATAGERVPESTAMDRVRESDSDYQSAHLLARTAASRELRKAIGRINHPRSIFTIEMVSAPA
jgi:hypothetical protein